MNQPRPIGPDFVLVVGFLFLAMYVISTVSIIIWGRTASADSPSEDNFLKLLLLLIFELVMFTPCFLAIWESIVVTVNGYRLRQLKIGPLIVCRHLKDLLLYWIVPVITIIIIARSIAHFLQLTGPGSDYAVLGAFCLSGFPFLIYHTVSEAVSSERRRARSASSNGQER